MSVYLLQQWITDLYKYTSTGHEYIIKRYRRILIYTAIQRVGQSTSYTDIYVAH